MRHSSLLAIVAIIVCVVPTLCAKFELSNGTPFSGLAECVWLTDDSTGVDYRLWWSLGENDIQIAVEAKTTGWIGIGFSKDGTMDNRLTDSLTGSDVYVGFINNGSLYAYDYYATQQSIPTKDAVQNLDVFNAWEHPDNGFGFAFTRPYNASESQDNSFDTTFQVIYAVGKEPPTTTEGDRFEKHFVRGHKVIHWEQSSVCSEKPPQGDSHKPSEIEHAYDNEDDTFGVEWHIHPDENTIHFKVKAKTTGWVAIGFSGTPDMIRSDAIYGWVSNGVAHIYDGYIGEDREEPKLDTALGGTSDIVVIGGSEKDGWTILEFERPLTNSDVYDVDFADMMLPVIWALGEDDGQTTEEEKIDDNDFDVGQTDYHGAAQSIHGIIMILAWVLLACSGNYVARYLRKVWKPWFWIHVSLQCFAVLLVLTAFVLIVAWKGEDNEHFTEPHEILGMIVVILTILQPLLGLLAHWRYDPNRRRTLVFPNIIHWIVGGVTTIAALSNIVLGIILYDVSMMIVYAFVAWFVVFIIFISIEESVKWYYHFKNDKVAYVGAPDEPVLDDDESDNIELEELGDEEDASTRKPKSSPKKQDAYVNPSFLEILMNNKLRILAFIINLALIGYLVYLVADVPFDPVVLPFQHCQDCQEKTFKFENYQIPVGVHGDASSNQTSYICKAFDLGEMADPYHIVEIDAQIDDESIVHHMFLYTVPYDLTGQGYYPCLTMPESATPLWISAVGAQSRFILPPQAGVRIGKGTDLRYAVLQIHYDNPTLATNRVDSSGVTLHFTRHLREFDVGFLLLAANDFSIPPGHNDYEIAGTCTKDETKLLPYDLTVFSAGIHAHRLGRKIWTEQYRDNKKIGWFPADYDYNFNEQRFRDVDITIKKNDELTVHCVYDSTSKTNTTFEGEGTNQEMCITMLAYYPKVDSIYCGSKGEVLDKNDGHWRPDTAL